MSGLPGNRFLKLPAFGTWVFAAAPLTGCPRALVTDANEFIKNRSAERNETAGHRVGVRRSLWCLQAANG